MLSKERTEMIINNSSDWQFIIKSAKNVNNIKINSNLQYYIHLEKKFSNSSRLSHPSHLTLLTTFTTFNWRPADAVGCLVLSPSLLLSFSLSLPSLIFLAANCATGFVFHPALVLKRAADDDDDDNDHDEEEEEEEDWMLVIFASSSHWGNWESKTPNKQPWKCTIQNIMCCKVTFEKSDTF